MRLYTLLQTGHTLDYQPLKTQKKYWLIIFIALTVTLAALCVVALLFWHQLPPGEIQQLISTVVIDYFAYFFSAGFILLLAFGFAADWIFRAYVIPINRLAEEVDLINTVNPSHRVRVRGSHDVRRLAHILNQSAELMENLQQKKSAGGGRQAQYETENQRATLATLLSDLPQGILVCNLDGRIVFYNRKVKDLLLPITVRGEDLGTNGTQWVGLGRSVHRFIDPKLIQEAMDRLAGMLAKDQHAMVSERFLVGTQHGVVLPAELSPVLDSQHHVTGFILYFEDVAGKMKQAEEESKHMQVWQHQLTQCISIINTATGILRDTAFESDQEYLQMVRILGEQSDLAVRLWTKKEIAVKWSDTPSWPLTPIAVKQWVRLLLKRVSPLLHLDIETDPENLEAIISIDIHQLTQCVVSILTKAQRQCHIDEAKARVYQRDTWLYMDIVWRGQGIGDNTLKLWKTQHPGENDHRPRLTRGDILAYHGIRLWLHRNTDQPDSSGLRLLIPTLDHSAPEQANGRVTILPESRPEFYDFDLFHQAGQSPELIQRRLSELTYTVFDTETTGLDPRGGDEIISIGAMRIVNGRLLQEQPFNQLIDPKRHLPWSSIKYHGIRPEMLVDQPAIEEVLPNFQRYAQDTVLIGHNVAFDMRMLQVKESVTNVSFVNPVLDTMLLSSVIHPAHESHNLSGVAERVGVNIQGRHTALGDAAATGEIFLKLVPLLAQKGIHTLGQATEASKKSYYARLKY